jgi:hypothetical protein
MKMETKSIKKERTKMEKKEKTYKIQISGRREKVIEGTLEYLKHYWGFPLYFHDKYHDAKTIKSLVSTVQKMYADREACCYSRTYVNLIEGGN